RRTGTGSRFAADYEPRRLSGHAGVPLHTGHSAVFRRARGAAAFTPPAMAGAGPRAPGVLRTWCDAAACTGPAQSRAGLAPHRDAWLLSARRRSGHRDRSRPPGLAWRVGLARIDTHGP